MLLYGCVLLPEKQLVTFPWLLQGITLNTSSTDYQPIKKMRETRFNGKSWELLKDRRREPLQVAVDRRRHRVLQIVAVGVKDWRLPQANPLPPASDADSPARGA
jgi:hypothetical protein